MVKRAHALTHHLNQSGALTNGQSRLTTKLNPARITYTHVCAIPWKIEQFPREIKQLTGENIVSAVKLEFPEIILLAMNLRGVGAQKFSR